MTSEITRYSEISRSHTILIDGFNEHTNRLSLVERLDFFPVYVVKSRFRFKTDDYVRYFLNGSDAFKHWSELQGEKEYLF